MAITKPNAQGEPAPPEVEALCLLALTASPTAQTKQQWIERRDLLATRIVGYVSAEGQFQPAGRDPLNQPRAALLTAALAGAYARKPDDRLAAALELSLKALYAQADEQDNIHALPWMMMAERLAGPGLARRSQEARSARDRRLTLLRSFTRELIDPRRERQITSIPREGPPDVLGGFRIQPEPFGTPPNPTWHSAGPVLFLALALQDPQLLSDDSDRHGPSLAITMGAGFLNRLTMRDASLFCALDRDRSTGGVRPSLSENRLATDAAAWSLLALTEVIATLDLLDEQDR